MSNRFNILDTPHAHPGAYDRYLTDQALTAGEGSMPRDLVASAVTLANQSLRLAYFTATKSETVTQARINGYTIAAGATPTLVRIGLWTVAANGDITLVASTPNDTTLLATPSTAYTKALSVAYAKVAGQRYAAGILVVTGATAPNVGGATTALVASEAGQAPMLGGLISGQADLPTGLTVAASVGASANRPYVVFLP